MTEMAPEPDPITGCRCGKPTRDNAYVCDTCADQLTKALAETPWIDTELETTLTGRRGVDYRTKGATPSSESQLPVNMAAANLRTDLHATLTSWVKFCHDTNVRHQSPHHGLPTGSGDAPPTINAMSRWLLWRVDGLTFHDIGSDCVDEITAIAAKATHLIDRPADKWFAGPCGECGAGMFVVPSAPVATCRAVLGVDANDDPVKCGFVVDVAKRRAELLVEAEDRLAKAADVARAVSWLGALPLTAERVRKWAERDRIFAKGHDGKSPLYRIGDAIDLLASDTSRTG